MQFPKALNEQRDWKKNYRFKGISLGLYRRGEGGKRRREKQESEMRKWRNVDWSEEWHVESFPLLLDVLIDFVRRGPQCLCLYPIFWQVFFFSIILFKLIIFMQYLSLNVFLSYILKYNIKILEEHWIIINIYIYETNYVDNSDFKWRTKVGNLLIQEHLLSS